MNGVSLFPVVSALDGGRQSPAPIPYPPQINTDAFDIAGGLIAGTWTHDLPGPQQPALGLSGQNLYSYFYDFYNRIYMSPLRLDLGAVSGDLTATISLWNAYQTPVTLTQITRVNAEGLSLGDITLPLRMVGLGGSSFTMLVSPDGPPTIDASFTFRFDPEEVFVFPVTGNRARLFDIAPNWQTSVTIETSFKTEIFQSHDGTETRRSMSTLPRRSISYQSWVSHRRMRRLVATMSVWQSLPVIVADYTRFERLSQPLGILGTVMRFHHVPFWMVAGEVLILSGDNPQMYVIDAVSGNEVTLVAESSVSISAETKMFHGQATRFNTNINAVGQTDEIVTIPLTFEFDDTGKSLIPLASPITMFDGREVLDKSPNRATGIAHGYSSQLESVDFGIGAVHYFDHGVPNAQIMQLDFIGKNAAEVEELGNFFVRHMGQFKEFFIPSHQNDLVIEHDILPNTASFRTLGRDDYNDYSRSKIERAVAIYHNGNVTYRRVHTFTQESDIDGTQFTGIQLTEAFPDTILKSDISRISWLYLARFGSDSLTMEYITDEVVNCRMSVRTLAYKELEL